MIRMGRDWGEFRSDISDMGLEDDVCAALYGLYGELGSITLPKSVKEKKKKKKATDATVTSDPESEQAAAEQSVDTGPAVRPPYGSFTDAPCDMDNMEEVSSGNWEPVGHIIKHESLNPAYVSPGTLTAFEELS